MNTSYETFTPEAQLDEYSISEQEEEIKDEDNLKEHYLKKNITTGNEPVTLDDASMIFPGCSPALLKQLKMVAYEIVRVANIQISEASKDESIPGRRRISININKAPFKEIHDKLIDKNINQFSRCTDEEYYNNTYLGCVIKKMIELKMIYKILSNSARGYILQA